MRMSCAPGAARERMHRRVEPPRLRRRSRTAAPPRARTASAGRAGSAAPADHGSALGARDVLHERRLVLLQVRRTAPAPRRVVIPGSKSSSSGVVRLGEVAVEALDVAPPQLEVLAQRRQERRRSRSRCARVDPAPAARARRRATSRRGAPTAPCAPSPSRGASTRIRLASNESCSCSSSNGASSSSRRPTSADVNCSCAIRPQRRELLRADGRAARRHHRLLVPREQRRGARRGR